MRRLPPSVAVRAVAVAVAVAVAGLAGCGGSGSRGAAAAGLSTSPSASAHHGGGLVATIDLARLESVCANARQADPLVQTGMDSAQADQMLTSASALLLRPPVDPAAAELARAVRRDVAAHREPSAVTALEQFCRARGG